MENHWNWKAQTYKLRTIMDFFINVFTDSVTKIVVIILKILEPATSCVRNQDATTVPARHICERQDL